MGAQEQMKIQQLLELELQMDLAIETHNNEGRKTSPHQLVQTSVVIIHKQLFHYEKLQQVLMILKLITDWF